MRLNCRPIQRIRRQKPQDYKIITRHAERRPPNFRVEILKVPNRTPLIAYICNRGLRESRRISCSKCWTLNNLSRRSLAKADQLSTINCLT
jgi:hypothetical protein